MKTRIVCRVCRSGVHASPQGGWRHDQPGHGDHAVVSAVAERRLGRWRLR